MQHKCSANAMPIQLQCSPNAVPPKFDFWDKDGKIGKCGNNGSRGSNGKKRRKLTSRDAFGCARHLKMLLLELNFGKLWFFKPDCSNMAAFKISPETAV